MVRSSNYPVIPEARERNMTASRNPSGPIKTSGSSVPARTFKVVVIGDMSVGKTCLICRLCGGKFPEHTETTIGVDFLERAMEIEGETVKVCYIVSLLLCKNFCRGPAQAFLSSMLCTHSVGTMILIQLLNTSIKYIFTNQGSQESIRHDDEQHMMYFKTVNLICHYLTVIHFLF